MVVEQFPMFRLATLLARQLSSPIAARIKKYAVEHPRAGAAVCGRVARAYHRAEWAARALALRLGGTRLPPAARPPPLATRASFDLGGDLLGEIIIFAFGSLIIIFEVNRQADKQEAKALVERSQWLAVTLSLEELHREVSLQQQELQRLRDGLHALHQPPSRRRPDSEPDPDPAPADGSD